MRAGYRKLQFDDALVDFIDIDSPVFWYYLQVRMQDHEVGFGYPRINQVIFSLSATRRAFF